MSLIEKIGQGVQARPQDLDRVVREVLLSDFDPGKAFKDYRTEEYRLRGMFTALVSRRAIESTYNGFDLMHPKQYDIYAPISLAHDALACHPVRTYEHPHHIDGAQEALRRNVVQPVRSNAMMFNGPVTDKSYGYLFTEKPLDLSQGEGDLPIALNDVDGITRLLRTNPDNWLSPFEVDQGMTETQANFTQFTEELLVHEGHQQVQVTVWR